MLYRHPLCAAFLSAALPLAAPQPEFRSIHPRAPGASNAAGATSAPNTPNRGRFATVEVVRSEGRRGAARVSGSRAIEVPRNTLGGGAGRLPDLEERLARNEQLAERWRDRPAPWRTDTSAFIEQVYPIDERFDGWSYGVYWNKVTRRWERGYHTTEFGLDPDFYR